MHTKILHKSEEYDMKNEEFLFEMLETVSVSGCPERLSEVIKKHMTPYSDKIMEDEIGDVVCVLNPESETRVLVTAHADEIGLIVSSITEAGMLQTIRRGGIIPHTYPGQQVQIETGKGVIYGVVQESRDLLKNPELKAEDFLIDIGAKNKEQAEQLVELGDCIVLDTKIRKLANGRFSARALDDRLGVFIIMEAFKRAKEKGCKCGVYCGATVGEETTKNGAYWTAKRVEPTIAVAVDVTYTSDCYGTKEADSGRVLLGDGPVLCNSPIAVKKLNNKLRECAKKADIKVQTEAASAFSYTDADKIHFTGKGVPTTFVSIPLRYMHSPAEVADEADVNGCIELLTEFLLSID